MENTLKPGQFITVEVESVFSDGIVVSYPTKEGPEYRGALLHSQQQPSVLSPNKELANPLTYLHDHPYSDFQKYAHFLRDKVPEGVLQGWNSHAVSETLQSPTTCNIASRLQPCREPAMSSHAINSLLNPNRRSAIVEAVPEKIPDCLMAPLFVPEGGRSAKYRAKERLHYQSSKDYQRSTFEPKTFKRRGGPRKRFGKLRKRKLRPSSLSPVSPSHTLLTVGPADNASRVLEGMQGKRRLSYSLPTSPAASDVSIDVELATSSRSCTPPAAEWRSEETAVHSALIQKGFSLVLDKVQFPTKRRNGINYFVIE